MLRAALMAAGYLVFLGGVLLVADYFRRRGLQWLSRLTSPARTYFQGDQRPLRPDEIKGLRRWAVRRQILWGGFVFVAGFILGIPGQHSPDADFGKLWLAAPLLLLAIVHDFLRRCPRCGTLMIRSTFVLLPRQCVKCGVEYR